MADDSPRRYAPYLAWKTFFNLVLEMADTGLPSRIDRSFLGKKSGLDQSYLIGTMKTFGLIAEDGTVLEPLKRLVSDIDGRPALVAELLRANYPEVFALPDNATQQQFDEAFRDTYGIHEATIRKAETFFMHAAAFAGVKLSPHLKALRGTASAAGSARPSGAKRPRRQKPAGSSETGKVTPPPATRNTPLDMKERYFDFLLRKAETVDDDKELLDRIERLIGEGQSMLSVPSPSKASYEADS